MPFSRSGQGDFHSRDTYEGELNEAPSLHRFAYAWGNPLRYTDFEGFDAGQAEQAEEEQYRYKEAESLVKAMQSPGFTPGSSSLKALAEHLPSGASPTPEQVDLECWQGDLRSCAGAGVMGAVEGVGSAATQMVVGTVKGGWWLLKSTAKTKPPTESN